MASGELKTHPPRRTKVIVKEKTPELPKKIVTKSDRDSLPWWLYHQ
jgi:hypothetical protein